VPGEGTVIRHALGALFRLAARSAQGPVHFPPTWRVMVRDVTQASQGRGRGRRRRAGWAPSGRERAEECLLGLSVFFLGVHGAKCLAVLAGVAWAAPVVYLC